MARTKEILEGYLEQVRGDIMDDYRDAIRAIIRGRSGIYALYRRDKLYYVGLATNLMGRVNGHLRDRHKGLWDKFSVYLTARSDQPHVRELEALLLRILVPKGNRVSGRLKHATNFAKALNYGMSGRDAQRRADLLGGAVANRLKRKQLTSGKKGAAALKGIAGKRIALRATYKGFVYSAALRTDGQVRYGGVLYETPSAAARVAVGGRRVNGWTFWRFRQRGEWVHLKALRKP